MLRKAVWLSVRRCRHRRTSKAAGSAFRQPLSPRSPAEERSVLKRAPAPRIFTIHLAFANSCSLVRSTRSIESSCGSRFCSSRSFAPPSSPTPALLMAYSAPPETKSARLLAQSCQKRRTPTRSKARPMSAAGARPTQSATSLTREVH